MTASLASLPDDLVLDIVQYLDTARDVAHFEATSRRARNLVHHSGWRSFVKTRFPSLNIPCAVSTGWNDVANRLTYLDRCWNKRGLYLTWFDERPPEWRDRRRRGGFMGQSVSFQSVLDARMVSSSQEELLVYGAGENLMLRRRPRGYENRDIWSKLEGRNMGYAAGTGDVTAMTIIERLDSPEIVVGRATGELQLLSAADETLGYSSQSLLKLDESGVGLGTSPGQAAVSWTEWQPQAKLLASCRGSILTLYNLSDTEEAALRPVMYYDAPRTGATGRAPFIRNAKFMSTDMIACGLGGCREPLRWGKIRPTGMEFFNAARNTQLDKDAEMGLESRSDDKTTVRAIEPVGGMNGNLLLSAWDDGSHRLSDLRTPSDHDALYRDRLQPYEASSSMLVYGSERFVTGSNQGQWIRFFDFRFPKPYHHTNAMPCSAQPPVPGRPYQRESDEPPSPVERCDHLQGRLCTWHESSTQESWRPDAVLHMGNPSFDRVYSMAKASDLSSSFYCGFRGTAVEMTLALAEDTSDEAQLRTAPEGWRATKPRGKVCLMETGVGLCSDEAWIDEHRGIPDLYHHVQSRSIEGMLDGMKLEPCSRLDSPFRVDRRRW